MPFRHTKNICVGTLFEEEDENGDPCVYRVVESRAGGENRNVCYVKHFDWPDHNPTQEETVWFESEFDEVKEWHAASRAVLVAREDLQPPTCMQDTAKTLEIYSKALYPTLRRLGIDEIVEDNASPHNNDDIRQSHTDNHARIIGYTATEDEKAQIIRLIHAQVVNYRREQDKKAQVTKQTRELDRLPAWPPNSPDLNLIEVIWSWMVKRMRDDDEGWPKTAEELKERVVKAWDDIPLDSFRELIRSPPFHKFLLIPAYNVMHKTTLIMQISQQNNNSFEVR